MCADKIDGLGKILMQKVAGRYLLATLVAAANLQLDTVQIRIALWSISIDDQQIVGCF